MLRGASAWGARAGFPAAYLDGHEQALARPLPQGEAAGVQCRASQGWLLSDLAGLRDGGAGEPERPSGSAADLLWCGGHPVLSVDQGALRLALRQTIGMVASLLELAGLAWPVPDCTTLGRRQKTVTIQIPYQGSGGNSDARRCHTLIVKRCHCHHLDPPQRPNLRGGCPTATSRKEILRASQHFGRAF